MKTMMTKKMPSRNKGTVNPKKRRRKKTMVTMDLPTMKMTMMRMTRTKSLVVARPNSPKRHPLHPKIRTRTKRNLAATVASKSPIAAPPKRLPSWCNKNASARSVSPNSRFATKKCKSIKARKIRNGPNSLPRNSRRTMKSFGSSELKIASSCFINSIKSVLQWSKQLKSRLKTKR